MAPYKAIYGRPCRSPVCWTKVGERPSTGPDLVRDTSEKVDLIWKLLLTVQSQQKRYAGRRRRPLEFEVGDHVFLKVMPKRGVGQVRQEGKAIVEIYRALRGTREGRYSCLSVGVTTKPIGCSCGIPCLYAPEIHSRSDSYGGLGRACC